MPIVRIGSKLVYFAHVPKCAGSGIEDYLAERFGPLGFLDRKQLRLSDAERWCASSPQHIDVVSLARLLPLHFFAEKFAVVRHPRDRIVSVFRYQRDIEKSIAPDVTFGAWLKGLAKQRQKQPFYLDNHPRPASELVPEGAHVFRLEDGLDKVVAWLDDLAGDQIGPRSIGVTNTYEERLQHKAAIAGPRLRITRQSRRLIEDLFAADFQRFGYPLEAPLEPFGQV